MTIVERIKKWLDAGNYTAGFIDLKSALLQWITLFNLEISICIVLEVL